MFRRSCCLKITAVPLAFRDWTPATATSPSPRVEEKKIPRNHLLVMHGLLGNSNNWSTLCGKFSALTTTITRDGSAVPLFSRVRSLDLRNHGQSPHSEIHTLDALAVDLEGAVEDLLAYDTEELRRSGEDPSDYEEKVVILGHSMGGGTLMNALIRNANQMVEFPSSSSFSKVVKGAVVVDITPIPNRAPDSFVTLKEHLTALDSLPLSQVKSLDQAHALLRSAVPNDGLRNFMLTNLRFHNTRTAPEKTGAYWVANVPVLKESLGPAMVFPHGPTPETYPGEKCTIPTLFVFGEKSEYYAQKGGLEAISHYFDNLAGMEVIPNAGHFVHHEQKELFLKAVTPFLEKILHQGG